MTRSLVCFLLIQKRRGIAFFYSSFGRFSRIIFAFLKVSSIVFYPSWPHKPYSFLSILLNSLAIETSDICMVNSYSELLVLIPYSDTFCYVDKSRLTEPSLQRVQIGEVHPFIFCSTEPAVVKLYFWIRLLLMSFSKRSRMLFCGLESTASISLAIGKSFSSPCVLAELSVS